MLGLQWHFLHGSQLPRGSKLKLPDQLRALHHRHHSLLIRAVPGSTQICRGGWREDGLYRTDDAVAGWHCRRLCEMGGISEAIFEVSVCAAIAAVTNYHYLSGLTQHRFILLEY